VSVVAARFLVQPNKQCPHIKNRLGERRGGTLLGTPNKQFRHIKTAWESVAAVYSFGAAKQAKPAY
jgi:hypothetical protein